MRKTDYTKILFKPNRLGLKDAFLLKRQGKKKPTVGFMRGVAKSGTRFNLLVNDLFDLSKGVSIRKTK